LGQALRFLFLILGEIIELISRVDETWWEGRIYQSEKRGWFPFNYVRELKVRGGEI